jgi:hypothetical protein
MTKTLRVSLSVAFLFVTGSFDVAEAQELGGLKDNLDLPLDAIGESTETEESVEVVVFYGQNLEGDGFFYTVDRSGSMQDSGELARAKQEISRNISEFSDRSQFGIVFFDARVVKFPSSGRPVEANPGMKAAALSWVAGMAGGSGSCMMEGIRGALDMANFASAKRRVLVYVGDGGGTCMGANEQDYLKKMVATVTSQNYNRVIINCIGVLMDASRTMQENFMKQVAQANGGSYRRI